MKPIPATPDPLRSSFVWRLPSFQGSAGHRRPRPGCQEFTSQAPSSPLLQSLFVAKKNR
jgi:hypothetical protein